MAVECVEILTLKECLWIKSYIFLRHYIKKIYFYSHSYIYQWCIILFSAYGYLCHNVFSNYFLNFPLNLSVHSLRTQITNCNVQITQRKLQTFISNSALCLKSFNWVTKNWKPRMTGSIRKWLRNVKRFMNESNAVVILYHVFILTAFDIILIYHH